MINFLPILLISLLQAPASSASCSVSDSLTVRNAHAMAYDDDQGVVMLFGGADEKQVLGDLWSWNGETWHCVSKEGPPPRTFPTLAYDAAAKRLILFGGNRVLFGSEVDTAVFLNDMWSWDGSSWTEIHVAMPPVRAEASMAYDNARKRMVLFGGYHSEDGKNVRLGDTWEWDGHEWELMQASGPSPHNGTAMVYDSHRKRIVLFGGNGASDETWEWDGQHWEQIEAAETPGRFNSAMAYDQKQRSVLRFGGWTGEQRAGDTWKYEGTTWTKVSDHGPVSRNHTAMAFDSRRDTIVLFGGHDGTKVFGDTWEWNGRSWSEVAGVPPRPREDNGH